MSGVFGVVDSRRRSNVERLLSTMGQAMTHRDWYVVETVADVPQGLGLGRIGIDIINRELNLTALAECVRFQQSLAEKTFSEGIEFMSSARMLPRHRQ